VSTALPFSGTGALVPSRLESDAFGFSVARLSIGGAWANDLPNADELASRVLRLVEQASENTIIVRFPSELVQVARLQWPGTRRAQHAGTLLYWDDPLTAASLLTIGLEAEVHKRGSPATDEFVAATLSIVADSFEGYLNHYVYNEQIPAAVARDGYVDWARRTIADTESAAVLLREEGEAIAAATLRFHVAGPTVVCEVELAAVASSRQSAGVYQDLWGVIRQAAHDAGAERLIISTQASNMKVQRAWARLRLLPLASFDTVHLIKHWEPAAPCEPGEIDTTNKASHWQ
jgi:GNAT superfamily N-acetyltransferase